MDKAGDLLRRVYPRVGGETRQLGIVRLHGWGLSPRGRGNPVQTARAAAKDGSIPAWAGKPTGPACQPPNKWVYPRVGGETRNVPFQQQHQVGLSPRGRGNLWPYPLSSRCSRSIPAWAGKPRSGRSRVLWIRVYPRVGGETTGTI